MAFSNSPSLPTSKLNTPLSSNSSHHRLSLSSTISKNLNNDNNNNNNKLSSSQSSATSKRHSIIINSNSSIDRKNIVHDHQQHNPSNNAITAQSPSPSPSSLLLGYSRNTLNSGMTVKTTTTTTAASMAASKKMIANHQHQPISSGTPSKGYSDLKRSIPSSSSTLSNIRSTSAIINSRNSSSQSPSIHHDHQDLPQVARRAMSTTMSRKSSIPTKSFMNSLPPTPNTSNDSTSTTTTNNNPKLNSTPINQNLRKSTRSSLVDHRQASLPSSLNHRRTAKSISNFNSPSSLIDLQLENKKRNSHFLHDLGRSSDVHQEQQQEKEIDDDQDLITQVPDHAELDEEMQSAIQSVIQAHSNQLINLRRLLSRADNGSSMSIHLLNSQIKVLQDRFDQDQILISKLNNQVDRLKNSSKRSQFNSMIPSHTNKINAKSSSGQNNSIILDFFSNQIGLNQGQDLNQINEVELRKFFRSLPPRTRIHLLHLLLESAIPGDLTSLRKYIEKLERSRRDFIGQLPIDLSLRCLFYLDLKSILNCRFVSHRWNGVITRSGMKLWRSLSLSLTSKDDEPPKPDLPPNQNDEDDDQDEEGSESLERASKAWFELYKRLHYREENWRKGLAQRVVVLKGHTGSIGAIKLRGCTLVTGSLDGTLRIWNVRTSNCLKIVKMPAPVSSLDFYGQYGPTGVIAAGGNDVGRVFLISMNGTLLSTLSGHNKGIRTLAMNSQYLVSGGYDKALVVWNWREGSRIVKFGQQTNPCAAISLFGSNFSSVQVDGVIRCFSILNRELLSQHKVVQTHSSHEKALSLAGGDMFQWFVAEARRVIIATKTKIYQLEYKLLDSDHQQLNSSNNNSGYTNHGGVDLSSPPKLISLTPIKHELNSGTLDVLKRRFAAAPRFATRLGDEMRIFIGHLPENSNESSTNKSINKSFESGGDDSFNQEEEEDRDDLQPIGGAWLNAGSSVSSRNPTCMSLSSDQLVVGCSDGLLYALDFCGTTYRQ